MRRNPRLSKIEFDLFHEYLSYDPNTGVFIWKKKTNRNVVVGSEAGVIYPKGYRGINLLGRQYQAHRVAWMMQTGEWPNIIDHVNGNKGDNRWSNLRNSDYSGNGANSGMKVANTSGFKGVSWNKIKKAFRAQVRKNYRPIVVGYFATPVEAARAYDKAATELFGSFAKTNAMLGLL